MYFVKNDDDKFWWKNNCCFMVVGLEIRYYLYYIYGNCNNILYINECLEKRVFICIYMGKFLCEIYNGGLS